MPNWGIHLIMDKIEIVGNPRIYTAATDSFFLLSSSPFGGISQPLAAA